MNKFPYLAKCALFRAHRLFTVLFFVALLGGLSPMQAMAAPSEPFHAQARNHASPNAVTFSNLSWCFLLDGGTANAIGRGDVIQVTGTLTNNGAADSFRIGTRLRNTSGTLRDLTFGGPTHFFGRSTAKNEKTGANIQDLNLLGASTDNSDTRESFGEVQNTLPIANGGSYTLVAQLAPGRAAAGTVLRVEFFAYDVSTNTLQGSVSSGSIPYNKGTCSVGPASSAIDVGSPGFTVTGQTAPQPRETAGWINVSKPVYTPTDGNVLFEITTLSTGSDPQYIHDFDQTTNTFVIDIIDLATNTTVRTITGNNVGATDAEQKSGCNINVSITISGSVSLICRVQQYYTNVSSTSGRTPDSGGFTYLHGTSGGGVSVTHVLTLPVASNSWLTAGTSYRVSMRAQSGTGSHYLGAAATDVFQFASSPTSAAFTSQSAKQTKKGVNRIKWETGTELGVVGFYVWRKVNNREWRQITPEPIVPQNIGSVSGSVYKFVDKQVKPGKTYRYKIEAVNVQGSSDWSQTMKVK